MIGFFVGALLSGTVLAIVFGALHLDAVEVAYRKGYRDGLNSREELKRETDF